MTPSSLTALLKQEAARLGFDLAGATPAARPPGIDRLKQWLADGHAGRMGYLADRAESYEHPRYVLDGVKSVDDPLFRLYFEQPYDTPHLAYLPWYVVLGNHDYNGNTQAQVDYSTERGRRWHLPNEYYRVDLPDSEEPLVTVLAQDVLLTWSMASNAFFSTVVRIQDDRGHAVASGGPYRFVRHPGYVAAILFYLVTPLMLGSVWTFIPSVLMVLLFVVRTALEDRTLREELDGYWEYAQRVRYRLLPGVW